VSKSRAWIQLAVAVAILFVFSSGVSAQTISCSSDDGNRHHCPADTRGGVRLVKQISGSACQQGYSWGFDRESIWVDHGCRAEFEVATYQSTGAGQGGTISCSSDDGGRHYCPADTRGGVRLVKQHSEAGCQQGYSWGADGRGIWVDHGCRADFAVAGYQPPPVPEYDRQAELRDFQSFLNSRPDMRGDLDRNPDLVRDRGYLQSHSDLYEFLEVHPRIREDANADPTGFVRSAILYGPERQPDMEQGLRYLRQAEDILSRALGDNGGHRLKAIDLIRQAEREVQEGINYANTH